MDAVTANRIAKAVRSSVCSAVEGIQVSADRFVLTSPFAGSLGEAFDVEVLYINDGRVRLHDGGTALASVDVGRRSTTTQQQVIREVERFYRVQVVSGRVVAEASLERLGDAYLALIQAATEISALRHMSAPKRSSRSGGGSMRSRAVMEAARAEVFAEHPGLERWMERGERGISSNAIVTHLTGLDASGGWRLSPPRDAPDLGRCLRLLAAVPTLRPLLAEMADSKPHGAHWRGLVDAWDELAGLYAADLAAVKGLTIAAQRALGSCATYRRMKEIEAANA